MKEQFHAVHLTNGEKTLYPGVRGSFNMEENQGELPKPPAAPMAPTPTQQQPPGGVGPSEKRRLEEQKALARIIPERIIKEAKAIVKAKKEEFGGVTAYAQLQTIDLTGITDSVIQDIGQHYNRRLGIGLIDIDRLNTTASNIENRLREPGISGGDRALAQNIINQLEQVLSNEQQQREVAMRERERYGTFYGERRLIPGERQIIKTGTEEEIDALFNRMFTRVDARPKDEFREAFGTAGEIEYNEFLTALNEALSDPALTEDQQRIVARRIQQYSNEKKLREVVHTANYAVLAGIGTEQLVNFVQGFQSELADLAFSKRGVVQAMHFYEQALLKVREENGGYIPYTEVVGDPKTGQMGRVEQLVQKYFNQALDQGLIPETEVTDAAGNIIGYEMEDWERNRAIALARGMGIITGRTIEIAASSKLPEEVGGPLAGRFASLYAQDIIRDIAPFRHLIMKFDIGKERNRVLAFLLNRKRSPWTKKELADWNWNARIDVINALVGDKEERFLGVLNPFKVGGILSRTTWRYGEDPTASAIGDFLNENPDNRNWIGTGVSIEKLRGNLTNPDSTKRAEAERGIKANLERIAKSQPLKLYFNILEVQDAVLRSLFGARLSGGTIGMTLDRKPINELTIRNLKRDIRYQQNPAFKVVVDQMVSELDSFADSLVVMQEQAVKERKTDLLNLNPTDPNLVTFINTVRNRFMTADGSRLLNKFIENLRDKEWKLPFNFGTDDLPWDKYRFGKTGGTSIARRWRDIGSEKKAVDGLLKLVTGMDTFKKPEDIITVLREMYNGVAGYDEGIAREVTQKFAEGVIKFYAKDWFARLPLGIGTIVGMTTGKASYAQAAFGRGAMAWDEIEINEFTRLIRDTGMLTIEQQHELQQKAGGGKKEVFYAFTRTIPSILALAFVVYMLTRLTKEK